MTKLNVRKKLPTVSDKEINNESELAGAYKDGKLEVICNKDGMGGGDFTKTQAADI